MDTATLKNLLKDKNLTDVSARTGLTRQTLHNFLNNRNTTLKTITALETFLHDEDVDQLYQSLAFYGAPLAVKKKHPFFNLQNTMRKALLLSKTDDLVASTLPYVFYKQRANLKLMELFRESVKTNTDKLFGYFLESANEFREFLPFKNFTSKMKNFFSYKDSTPTKFDDTFVTNEFLPLYTKNKVALSWGLLDRGDFQHHLDRFEKWLKAEEK